MKAEHIIIFGLVLVIAAGAAYWAGSLVDEPPLNNGRDTPPVIPPRGEDHPPVGDVDIPFVAGPTPPIPPGTEYEFDAPFEPPVGYVIHGSGSFDDGKDVYLSILKDQSVFPQTSSTFVELTTVPNDPSVRGNLDAFLTNQKKTGRTTEIFLGFESINGIAQDGAIANTTKYDASIDALADKLIAHGKPVYIRIAGEMNGPWAELHPYVYPKAYQKIVDRFRAKNADNVVFVWCTEPSAGNDFDVKNAQGEWKWYPGDDYVDWAGIDLFFTYQFHENEAEMANGKITQKGVTERFLKFAKEHNKPVMIPELSAGGTHITASLEDGKNDWNNWFVPFFAFLEKHPEIKAFYYIDEDWTPNPSYVDYNWGDARISNNAYVSQKWNEELSKTKYLHVGDDYLLNVPA